LRKWGIVAWNVVVAVCTLAAVFPLAYHLLMVLNQPLNMSEYGRRSQTFVLLAGGTYALLFISYGLHASTLYSHFRKWKLAPAIGSTALVLSGVVLSIAAHPERSDSLGFMLLEFSCHTGPLFVLTMVVVLTRRSVWELAALLLVRLGVKGIISHGKATDNTSVQTESETPIR